MDNEQQNDLDAARLTLESDRVQREQACIAAYNQIVQELQARYRCVIAPIAQIGRDGRIVAAVEIAARP